MSQQLVRDALDRAITAVAKDEFKRLRSGLSRFEVAQEVEAALNSLNRLRRGVMPEYDKWDALFYITWYQPSHINLTYSIIKEMLSESVFLNDGLHVADFGCGSLAMQFGVALAVADEIEQGRQVTKIRFELIDDSKPMVRLGKKLWKQFKIEVNKESRLSHLAEACKIIRHRRNTSASVKRQRWANACWVSAVHAVYRQNKEVVKQELSALVNTLSPNVCYTTTHNHEEGRNLLSEIWTSNSELYNSDWERTWKTKPQFSGNLSRVTQWRTSLCERLFRQPIGGIDDSLIRNYLSNPRYPVTWQWRDAAILVHTRRR